MMIILLGAPGVGKGTQAKLIMGKYEIPQISTGDILRAEVQKSSPLGREAKIIMEKGELVPDNIILQIIEIRLKNPDCQNGFILDGFPRTIEQAIALDESKSSRKFQKKKVLEIGVPEEEIIKRLTNRRVCINCGKTFNLLFNGLSEATKCTNCGHVLIQRDDDKEEIIRNRLKVYRFQTEPLISYYRDRGSFYKIDGLESVENVFQDIQEILEKNGFPS